EFNGIKCIGADGLEGPRAFEETIERSVEGGTLPSSPFDRIGEIARDDGGAARYLEGILATVDRTRIAARKLRVVLDCGNGASVRTSPELLRRLGCRVVTLNGHLDGRFPGHGSEPTEANLADLMRTVPSVGADLGIAHDGDADRAVFVDARGRYVPGEKILSLMARDRVRRRGGGIVVTPVSGSQAVEEVVRPLGGEVVYTRVGSPSVTREMQRRRAVFGGEENGGLIFPELQLARDGAMTAAAVLDYLAQSDQSIETAIADLPSYTMVKRKVACPPGQGEAVIAEVARGLGSWSERQESLDGLKVYPKGGWVLLRPSGTEPLIRVFAESKDPAVAGALADEGTRRVEAALRALPARPG
ncbi:MAG TPA: phosphoglucosamine mutase, partial [Thermoplasmata archaeon]|nr:phosphoglucosamine mutase [Thermoplasmata archaeon]